MGDVTKTVGKGRQHREERLAAQLRQNLKRRKAQERAREASAEAAGLQLAGLDPATKTGNGGTEGR